MSLQSDLTRRQFAIALGAVLLLSVALRIVYPTADPPWHTPVGITWHDEGPWVHNARNRALFGQWTLDRWNPMYLAPVFTGLEYASFASFGVGTWQARLVSEAMGTLSVFLLSIGVAAIGGRRAGLIAGLLLGVNFIYVMWNRAALMETTMTAFMVAAWSAYSLASRHVWWGLVAGFAAVLSFFTKAAAAFFLGALSLDAILTLWLAWRGQGVLQRASRDEVRAALWTLAGLAAAGLAALIVFVVPYWTEFRFYNWQMSVMRKPSYTIKAFLDRASWIPVIHDFFTRQWVVTVLALAACLALLSRWRVVAPAERLLGLWIALGFAELVAHDVGNERRFVLFIPALTALAALALARDRRVLPASMSTISRQRAAIALPLILLAAYIVVGAIARLPYLYQVRPVVYLSTMGAIAATAVIFASWRELIGWLSGSSWSVAAAWAVAGTLVAIDLVQFGQWAMLRTYKNVTASKLVGEWLPPETLVHGKLANGLALENRIRPIFVGRGFGNYEDRTGRRDVRYILTYTSPRLGYEGAVILDVLAANRGWTIVHEFDVAETAAGTDRAALIRKP